jgi:hypothetical protein
VVLVEWSGADSFRVTNIEYVLARAVTKVSG